MNGKKSKMIRKIAEAGTIGKPKVKYFRNLEGGIHLGDCTRKFINDLKRMYKHNGEGLVI